MSEIIAQLEKNRKKMRLMKIIGCGVFMILFLAMFIMAVVHSDLTMPVFIGAFFVFTVMVVVSASIIKNPRDEFERSYQRNIVFPLLQEVFEQPIYNPDEGFDRGSIESFWLVTMGNSFRSEDYVSGSYHGITFYQSDVHTKYHARKNNGGSKTYFMGRVLVFDIPRKVVRPIRVYSKKFPYAPPAPGGLQMVPVQIGSEMFVSNMTIMAVDEKEAQYFLTSEMIGMLNHFHKTYGSVALDCHDGKLYLGLKGTMNAFNADLKKPITLEGARAKLMQDIQPILDVVNVLNTIPDNV